MTDVSITGWAKYELYHTYLCKSDGSVGVQSNNLTITAGGTGYVCARATSVDLTCCAKIKYTFSCDYDVSTNVRVWIGSGYWYPSVVGGAVEIVVPSGSQTTGQIITISYGSSAGKEATFSSIVKEYVTSLTKPTIALTVSGSPVTYVNSGAEVTLTATTGVGTCPAVTGWLWQVGGYSVTYKDGYTNTSNPTIISGTTGGERSIWATATNLVGSYSSDHSTLDIYRIPTSIVVLGDTAPIIGIEDTYSLTINWAYYDTIAYTWSVTGGVETTDYTVDGGYNAATFKFTAVTDTPTKINCSVLVYDPNSDPIGAAVTDYLDIGVLSCVAAFSADKTAPTTVEDVTFTNSSEGTGLTYTWSFPEMVVDTDYSYQSGTDENTKDPVVQFLTPKSFTVVLTVVKSASTCDTETKTDYIVYSSVSAARMKKDFGILVNNKLYKVK